MNFELCSRRAKNLEGRRWCLPGLRRCATTNDAYLDRQGVARDASPAVKPLNRRSRAKRNSTIRVPETFAKVVSPIRRERRQIASLAQELLVCRIRVVQTYDSGNGNAMRIAGKNFH